MKKHTVLIIIAVLAVGAIIYFMFIKPNASAAVTDTTPAANPNFSRAALIADVASPVPNYRT